VLALPIILYPEPAANIRDGDPRDFAAYASPLRLSPRRKTRFRLAATLDRSGFQPAGFVQEVSVLPLVTLDSRHLFPLLQAFPGARLAPFMAPFITFPALIE
jgi:hypothetical protein